MLQYPKFDPVALQIGPLAIHWYGLMYLAGFALVYLLGRRRITSGHTTSLNVRDLEDLIFYSVLGVVLGGRLGYVLFYKPSYYLAHPLEVAYLWEGGMSFHGGLIGVIPVSYTHLDVYKRQVNHFTFTAAPDRPRGWLPPSRLATSFRPPYRVNPDLPSPAKPKTIAQFLQVMQPVSYTHLDVYKRQTSCSATALTARTTPGRRRWAEVGIGIDACQQPNKAKPPVRRQPHGGFFFGVRSMASNLHAQKTKPHRRSLWGFAE